MAAKLSEKMRTLLTALAEAGDAGIPCWDKRFHLGTARALANRRLAQKEHSNALVTRWRITEEGRFVYVCGLCIDELEKPMKKEMG